MLEELRDEDEDVEIQRNHGGDGVGASPDSIEMPAIEGEDCEGQNDQRKNAEDDPWGHFCVGKGEAGDAGQHGRDQEYSVRCAEESAAEKAEEDNDSRGDADED